MENTTTSQQSLFKQIATGRKRIISDRLYNNACAFLRNYYYVVDKICQKIIDKMSFLGYDTTYYKSLEFKIKFTMFLLKNSSYVKPSMFLMEEEKIE